ncbi:putative TIM-barrel fold metal-dependent hydrolase [Rhizobium sp. BK313]|uniref:amidohydrolase family protein n=1 Tax=Rhizobium sp. BK313 TaxID=2587081 RepID=UPI0010D6B5DD|nr:amidohydrolase family protein [Rhizobium sp. BK313]MBB3458326.1 putative TIM-barrel fold metal-dependent hydrolase [Rhizobium sp. BK313]
MTILECAPARAVSRRPIRRLPAGAVDCHFHVFGPQDRFPYASGRSYTPPDASIGDYEVLAEMLGFSRAVIVQPSVYGLDNSRTLSFLYESRIPARAVLVLDPSVSENELEALHESGVRGVRLNLVFAAGLAMTAAAGLADKIRDLGWHLQFLADVSQIEDLKALVSRLDIPIVFDHLGHVPVERGVHNRGFQDLLGLVRDGRAWVKMTGAYRVTAMQTPPYDDAAPFVEALLKTGPGQLVTGTDWPHPSITVPVPDDTDLMDMFGSWVGDAELRQKIFVENPERLYGFDAWPT